MLVTVSDTEQVSEQEVAALQLLGFYSIPGDGAEQLYAPQCADGEFIGAFPDTTAQFIRSSECFDVIGESLEDAVVEYIGCPEQDSVDDEAYRPITQEGTLAPPDWREHVTQVAPASISSFKAAPDNATVKSFSKANLVSQQATRMLSSTNPYHEHRDSATDRSSGQVVSESKRAEAHNKASKVQSKLAAQEKAKKAANKRR